MSINVTESCNLNQQPITTQPQVHQLQHNYSNNKQQHLNYTTPSYQPTSSTTDAQLTSLNSSGQLNKKSQQSNQLKSSSKTIVPNSTNTNNNNQTSNYRKVFIQRDYSEGMFKN